MPKTPKEKKYRVTIKPVADEQRHPAEATSAGDQLLSQLFSDKATHNVRPTTHEVLERAFVSANSLRAGIFFTSNVIKSERLTPNAVCLEKDVTSQLTAIVDMLQEASQVLNTLRTYLGV
jgi:hypothetical protein